MTATGLAGPISPTASPSPIRSRADAFLQIGRWRPHGKRQAVWNALLHPESLRQIIPGCESVELTGDTYRARVRIAVAGIGATYDAELRMFERHEPERLRLSGRATSKVGFGRGEAYVTFTETAPGTPSSPMSMPPTSAAGSRRSGIACSTASCGCCWQVFSAGCAPIYAARSRPAVFAPGCAARGLCSGRCGRGNESGAL
jgi:hypothetical protein